MTENVLVGTWDGRGENKSKIKKGHGELLRVREMFIILITVMVSWLYTYVKTCQILHFQMPLCRISISLQLSYTKMESFLNNISIVTISPTWIYHSWSVTCKWEIILVTVSQTTQIVLWEVAALALTESLSETLAPNYPNHHPGAFDQNTHFEKVSRWLTRTFWETLFKRQQLFHK